MDIIFCDNHLLVVNKPKGLSTQTHGKEISLEKQAKEWIKKKYQKPGKVFLEPIHRLDKPVSGLVLFARTSKALSRLQAMMRDHKIVKVYVAKVEGRLPLEEGTLEDYLIHDEFRSRIVDSTYPNSKKAILKFRVISKTKETSLIEIVLYTGRYHQIRIQLSHAGCPIVGDQKYGSRFEYEKKEGIALHHARLSFIHPVTQELLEFSEPSSFFEAFLAN